MLKVRKLTKYYRDRLGIENINLDIKEGEVFGLIGPTGAGKSTFINVIMGLTNINSGEIYINGNAPDIKNKYKNDISFLPSELRLYDDFTGRQMIDYAASFYDGNFNKKIDYLVNKLSVLPDVKIGSMSFVEKKKIGIVIAFMRSSKLIVLDNPTFGLDSLTSNVLFNLLEEEKKKGTTILFSTCSLNEVKRACDRVGFINCGHLLKVLSVRELFDNNYSVVTIVGDEYKKMKLPIKDIIIKNQTSNSIKFVYKGNINDLIEIVSSIRVDDFKMEEPTIEDMFSDCCK